MTLVGIPDIQHAETWRSENQLHINEMWGDRKEHVFF